MIQELPEEELFTAGNNACSGCGPAIVMRHAIKAAGKNTIVVGATGCMEVVSTLYPYTSWKVPYIHGAFENAAAIASGVDKALEAKGKDTNVLVLAGDGATFDIGFGALSGAIERQQNICYVCYDNSAYANTGIQRSGATPRYASTTTSPAGKVIHGKQEPKKNMPIIMAAHRSNIYVATANIAYVQDFVNKVKKGVEHKGPAYIQVFAPCVSGWKYSANKTIEVAKLAYESKVTPLYEIENGKLKFNMKPDSKTKVKDYLKTQGRFSHLNNSEIKDVQKFIDTEYSKLEKMEKVGEIF